MEYFIIIKYKRKSGLMSVTNTYTIGKAFEQGFDTIEEANAILEVEKEKDIKDGRIGDYSILTK